MSEFIKINAAGKPLGRVASRAAFLLQGKDRPGWRPERREGSVVRIYNVNDVKLTGKKARDGVHYRHSSYPGGLKIIKVKDVLAKDPRLLLRQAIRGMLPRNRLRPTLLKRLQLFRALPQQSQEAASRSTTSGSQP